MNEESFLVRFGRIPYHLNWNDEKGFEIKRDEDYDFESQVIAQILSQEEDYAIDALASLKKEIEASPSRETFLAKVEALIKSGPLNPASCTQESVTKSTSTAYLYVAAKSPRNAVLVRVAAHPNLTKKLARKLYKNKHFALILALARNPSTPATLLAELVPKMERSPYGWDKDKIIKALSRNPNTPEEAFLSIMQSGKIDGDIYYNIACNPGHTEKVFKRILSLKYSVFREMAIYSHHLNAEILERLLIDVSWPIRRTAVKTNMCSLNQLLRASQDQNEYVRRAVLSYSPLNKKILSMLLGDSDPDTRWRAARHKSLSSEMIDSYLDKPDGARDGAFAFRADLSFKAMDILAHRKEDIDAPLRERLAGNLIMPAELLDYLGRDGNFKVRMAVAYNPNTPLPTLQRLLSDSSMNVRNAAQKAQARREKQVSLTKATKGIEI